MTPERIEERRRAQERQRKIQIAKCNNPKMLRTLGITIKKMALGILATNKKRNSLMLELNNLYSASAAMGIKIARAEENDLYAMSIAEVQAVIESTKEAIR